jgi:AGZA family xanthine/uracil permease-like MFS transporter
MRHSPPFSWKGMYLSTLWSGEEVIQAFPDRWLFVILSLLGLRQWLVRIMPQSLVAAVGAGIGLFIA